MNDLTVRFSLWAFLSAGSLLSLAPGLNAAPAVEQKKRLEIVFSIKPPQKDTGSAQGINATRKKIEDLTAKSRRNIMSNELLKASAQGNTQAVIDLLELGADPNSADSVGWTPLMMAAQEGHNKTVRVLLSAGANPDQPLIRAVSSGHAETVRILLGAGANPNALDNDFRTTALIKAAVNGGSGIIEMLLAAGANPDRQNIELRSALMEASSFGHLDSLKILLKAKADPNLKDVFGYTALAFAIKDSLCNDNGIIGALLASGADPNLKNEKGFTPLMLAVGHCRSAKISQALLDAGANPNLQDNLGYTALSQSAIYGDTANALTLLYWGKNTSDPAIKNVYGYTALDIAKDWRHRSGVEAYIEMRIKQDEEKRRLELKPAPPAHLIDVKRR